MSRRLITVTAAASGAVLALGLALAPASALTEAEISVLAGSCANCHGTDGRSPGTIPPIAGQAAPVLEAQLKAFKAKQTPGTTVMDRLASGYTDEQIAALARYFSQVKN